MSVFIKEIKWRNRNFSSKFYRKFYKIFDKNELLYGDYVQNDQVLLVSTYFSNFRYEDAFLKINEDDLKYKMMQFTCKDIIIEITKGDIEDSDKFVKCFDLKNEISIKNTKIFG